MVNLCHQCLQMSVLTLYREAQGGSLLQEITSFSVMHRVENMLLRLPTFISDLVREEGKRMLKKKKKRFLFF